MEAVVALDGDLLVPAGVQQGIAGQIEAIEYVVAHLGVLIENGHRLVITHGNASQVGFMLLRGEVARHVVHSLPLDVCGADTQGATGYMLQRALVNWFAQRGLDREVSTIVTQVVVGEPTPQGAPRSKGIGPFFDWERAQALSSSLGWEFEMVPGHGYQRIVPCLTPKRIVEARSIRFLFDCGAVVICSGGGGIPVREDGHANMVGIEAVVDKAYTAVLLAQVIGAETIIFVSPLERIVKTFQLSRIDTLHRLNLSDIDRLMAQGESIQGTMRHKLIATRKFLQEGGKAVLMVPPEQLGAIPDGCHGVKLSVEEADS